MSEPKRAAKRWKRENREQKGVRVITPFCRKCGEKLTRYGCPNCHPSIGSMGLHMYRTGQISGPELSLVSLFAGQR